MKRVPAAANFSPFL